MIPFFASLALGPLVRRFGAILMVIAILGTLGGMFWSYLALQKKSWEMDLMQEQLKAEEAQLERERQLARSLRGEIAKIRKSVEEAEKAFGEKFSKDFKVDPEGEVARANVATERMRLLFEREANSILRRAAGDNGA